MIYVGLSVAAYCLQNFANKAFGRRIAHRAPDSVTAALLQNGMAVLCCAVLLFCVGGGGVLPGMQMGLAAGFGLCYLLTVFLLLRAMTFGPLGGATLLCNIGMFLSAGGRGRAVWGRVRPADRVGHGLYAGSGDFVDAAGNRRVVRPSVVLVCAGIRADERRGRDVEACSCAVGCVPQGLFGVGIFVCCAAGGRVFGGTAGTARGGGSNRARRAGIAAVRRSGRRWNGGRKFIPNDGAGHSIFCYCLSVYGGIFGGCAVFGVAVRISRNNAARGECADSAAVCGGNFTGTIVNLHYAWRSLARLLPRFRPLELRFLECLVFFGFLGGGGGAVFCGEWASNAGSSGAK